MKDSITVRLNTLNFLCNRMDMPVTKELTLLFAIFGEEMNASKSRYEHILYTGESFTTFSPLSDKELKSINRKSLKVKPNECVLDTIEELLEQLRSEAPRGTKRKLNKLCKAIVAMATDKAKRKPQPKNETIPVAQESLPEEPDERQDDRDDCCEILPNGDICLKEDLNPYNPDAESYTEEEEEEEEEEVESYMDVIGRETAKKVIELSVATHLPVVYLQTIDEKHVKAKIYCRCLIAIGGERKISKKAHFINCEFTNKPLKK